VNKIFLISHILALLRIKTNILITIQLLILNLGK